MLTAFSCAPPHPHTPQTLQKHIMHEMTHNALLRVVVAMESALSDGRYEEAAKLRDEYRRLRTQPSSVSDRLV